MWYVQARTESGPAFLFLHFLSFGDSPRRNLFLHMAYNGHYEQDLTSPHRSCSLFLIYAPFCSAAMDVPDMSCKGLSPVRHRHFLAVFTHVHGHGQYPCPMKLIFDPRHAHQIGTHATPLISSHSESILFFSLQLNHRITASHLLPLFSFFSHRPYSSSIKTAFSTCPISFILAI